jgi:hypothetical protein
MKAAVLACVFATVSAKGALQPQETAFVQTKAATFDYKSFDNNGVFTMKIANRGQKVKLSKEQQQCCKWFDLEDSNSPLKQAGYNKWTATKKGFAFRNAKSTEISCDPISGAAGKTHHTIDFKCTTRFKAGIPTQGIMPSADSYNDKGTAQAGTNFWHHTEDGTPMGWKSEWGEFEHSFYAIVPNGFYGCSGLTTDGYCEDPFYYGTGDFDPAYVLGQKF